MGSLERRTDFYTRYEQGKREMSIAGIRREFQEDRMQLVPLGRLERPTPGLGNRCSIHLSYRGVSGEAEHPTFFRSIIVTVEMTNCNP
jgi:hypothetical protein